MADLSKLANELSSLTVLEGAELAKLLKEKWHPSKGGGITQAKTSVIGGSKGRMSWGTKTIAGVVYGLTHLDPFVFDVTPKAAGAPTYRVLVSFGCHCFARELTPADSIEHYVPDGKTGRCFCPIRTAHSQHLPRIICGASNGLAFFSKDTNMLLVEKLAGLGGPYAVFFNVKPSSKTSIDVAMFVASAYEKPLLVKAMPAVPFTALIAKASKGHVPFKPKRLTKW
jgi:hypothetical protein